MSWGSHVAVVRCDVLTYVDMTFTRCTKEDAYASRLALVVRNGSELTDAASVTHFVEYVALPRPLDSLHVLTNLKYWWRKNQFEQRRRDRHHAALFINCHFVNNVGVPNHDCEQFFVCVPQWWSSYEVCRLPVAPTFMVFDFHSTLALRAEHPNLLLRIAV